MPNTNELACKMIRKLQQRGLVKPGTFRVIVDIDIINGVQQHSFGKDEGAAAKNLIDGVYALLDKYVPPKATPKPEQTQAPAAKQASRASRAAGNGNK